MTPRTTPTAQAALVARREIAIELAGRDGLTVVAPLVLAATVLAGLGLSPLPEVQRALSPGLVWLVVLLTAAPLARGTAAAERAEDCWDLLRGLVPPGPLLAGKGAVLWLWLAATWALGTLLTTLLLGAAPTAAGLAAGALGSLGLAAVTTVFGTVLAAAERRGALLPVLVLPAGLPALVAGSQAATPGVAALPWLALLVAYDLVACAVAWAVFPVLLEE